MMMKMMLLLPSRLVVPFIITTIAATTIGKVNCQKNDNHESRQTYVPYPPEASSLLLEEVEDVGSPIGMEVVTSLAIPPEGFRSSSSVWNLLKGIVHRLRNQNQIIHANPHYYVSNGLDLGCRELVLDEDTGYETEMEVIPTPRQCVGACTNHGRYCVVEQESFNPNVGKNNSRGAMLVEETLRRICFVEIYHGSDLRFWEYMEEFDRLECFKADNMKECAMRAVYNVPHVDYPPLDACMHLAGGLDQDDINVRLKEEMDKSQNPNNPYVLTDVPFIRVGGKKYGDGDIFNVPHLFEFICSIYEEERGISPIACEFCGGCRGVRACLWQLHCDGRPFVTSAFQDAMMTPEEEGEQEQLPPPPNTQAAPPVAVPVASPQPTFAPTAASTIPPVVVASTTNEPIQIQSPEPTNLIIDILQSPTPFYNNNSSAVPEQSVVPATIATTPAPVLTITPSASSSSSLEQEKEIVEEPLQPLPEKEQPQDIEAEESPVVEDMKNNDTSNLDGTIIDGTWGPVPVSAQQQQQQQQQEDADEDEEEEVDDDDDDYRYDYPFMKYGVPVLVAAGILGIYFLVSYLSRRHHERQVSSAEEYFNDLMNESYKDNMAISGRIEDEMSDRSMEDMPIDDMSGAAPPFASFKVHMVMN